MSPNTEPTHRALTPLWVLSIFVTLTETVLGVGVIHTIGGIQIALTAFVIAFATLVALGFFLILWFRPQNFYSPGEFEKVDVAAYVSAMRNTPAISGDRVYSQIESGVKTVLASPEIVSMIKTLIQGTGKIAPNVDKVLGEVAGEVIEGIRKLGFISIDISPLDKNKSQVLQVPYDKELKVDQFLNIVYFSVNKPGPIAVAPLMPYTYAKAWILRDRASGIAFDKMGTAWARSHGKNEDDRLLAEVGISPGMVLQAEKINTV